MAAAQRLALGPIRLARPSSHSAPRSTEEIFREWMWSRCVLNCPASCWAWTAICSIRFVKTCTSRPSQRTHTCRPTYSGGTE